ncbi:610_t:CDS:2 [Entrophospora sp. SA101]|nr:610_t:CDS:2 [Entrophospora sp. SA101]
MEKANDKILYVGLYYEHVSEFLTSSLSLIRANLYPDNSSW